VHFIRIFQISPKDAMGGPGSRSYDRRRLLFAVVGCTTALALLAAIIPSGSPAELQQRGLRGRRGTFSLAAQKIARAAAILRCVRTQGLKGGCPMAKVSRFDSWVLCFARGRWQRSR